MNITRNAFIKAITAALGLTGIGALKGMGRKPDRLQGQVWRYRGWDESSSKGLDRSGKGIIEMQRMGGTVGAEAFIERQRARNYLLGKHMLEVAKEIYK